MKMLVHKAECVPEFVKYDTLISHISYFKGHFIFVIWMR